ncbi:hypothetical protein QUA08_17025 [Microcoleus sp. T3B2]
MNSKAKRHILSLCAITIIDISPLSIDSMIARNFFLLKFSPPPISDTQSSTVSPRQGQKASIASI